MICILILIRFKYYWSLRAKAKQSYLSIRLPRYSFHSLLAMTAIMHIDLNSCFATSMQQAYFHLRGKPVVAAAYETDRGCVLSPSIEAKTYGIKTGMRVFEARKLCPNLIVRMTETGLVRDIHLKFKKICQEYTPLVSPLSIDEMVLNFSPVGKIQEKTLVELGREIKQRIKYEIGDWM